VAQARKIQRVKNGGGSKAEAVEQREKKRGRGRRVIAGQEGVEREQVDVDSGSTSHMHQVLHLWSQCYKPILCWPYWLKGISCFCSRLHRSH